jgi:hypothetical protein
MFYPALPIGSKEVEAQAVSAGIDHSQEPSPEGEPKRRFKQALEDKELNSLAVIFAERPCSVRKLTPTRLSAQKPISAGLIETSPTQTIPSKV